MDHFKFLMKKNYQKKSHREYKEPEKNKNRNPKNKEKMGLDRRKQQGVTENEMSED